jgi:hypothetical protein
MSPLMLLPRQIRQVSAVALLGLPYFWVRFLLSAVGKKTLNPGWVKTLVGTSGAVQ